MVNSIGGRAIQCIDPVEKQRTTSESDRLITGLVLAALAVVASGAKAVHEISKGKGEVSSSTVITSIVLAALICLVLVGSREVVGLIEAKKKLDDQPLGENFESLEMELIDARDQPTRVAELEKRRAEITDQHNKQRW